MHLKLRLISHEWDTQHILHELQIALRNNLNEPQEQLLQQKRKQEANKHILSNDKSSQNLKAQVIQ